MTGVHFGLVIPAEWQDRGQRATYVADLDRALELISGHFESAWMIDHLQSGEADLLECMTTLAYMAGRHPQLKFGSMVLCQSFRNPALAAKMGATLQLLSGGRFILGLGAGGLAEEHRAYGYGFPPPGVRVEQLAEAVQIIKTLWSGQKTTFLGKYYQVIDACCQPAPDPVPSIIVGAFRPKMLRLAAQYADEWNVSSTGAPGYRRMLREFEQACAEVGRDPATVRRSWGNGCACMPTQAEAERIAGDRFNAQNPEDDFGFVGTPGQVIEQMRPFIDLGVDRFMLDCGGFPNLTTLELLVNEVLPALTGA